MPSPDLPPEIPPLALAAGDARALVTPQGGGLLGYWSETANGRRPWLRPSPDSPTSPLQLSCFPLVPWFSRIRGGRFTFQGREIRLPFTVAGIDHAVHGHGWQAAWDVAEASSDRVRLTCDHAADAWPWAYRATLDIGLSEAALTLSLALENLGDAAMPAGLGLHPFFPRLQGARLRANVAGVWLSDKDLLPLEPVPLPQAWPLRMGLAVADANLDHVFHGWDGTAEINWPRESGGDGAGLTLTASPSLGFLVVVARPGRDFFVAEPASHITDAVNLAAAGRRDTGLEVLAPGERLTGWMRLEPTAGA